MVMVIVALAAGCMGCILSLIFNDGCGISFSAAARFPFLYSAKIGSELVFLFLAACSVGIICKHIDNIRKIRAGEGRKIREFLKNIYSEGAKAMENCDRRIITVLLTRYYSTFSNFIYSNFPHGFGVFNLEKTIL